MRRRRQGDRPEALADRSAAGGAAGFHFRVAWIDSIADTAGAPGVVHYLDVPDETAAPATPPAATISR